MRGFQYYHPKVIAYGCEPYPTTTVSFVDSTYIVFDIPKGTGHRRIVITKRELCAWVNPRRLTKISWIQRKSSIFQKKRGERKPILNNLLNLDLNGYLILSSQVLLLSPQWSRHCERNGPKRNFPFCFRFAN